MKKAADALEDELDKNRMFAKKMEGSQVLLRDYICFWYGDERGAKTRCARDLGVSPQQVNRWLNLNVYIENRKLKRPDPNPIDVVFPDWIESYFTYQEKQTKE
ncbi:hypothetical protein [Photobacterium chitinilyticum]|uniref:Uncharacterized protein n=1 Tax=Photobacterium chitinilyticum TaxID=2485123 RepID=A0A3S3QXW3_9GAMM|nr:hypothetical protein [Photobacterium chitinilyticum]RWX52866.1 hypothetical protein EDI28_25090 [Photobacterium chitinilyticum]